MKKKMHRRMSAGGLAGIGNPQGNLVGKAHITALPTNTAGSAEASSMPSSYMAAKLRKGAVKAKSVTPPVSTNKEGKKMASAVNKYLKNPKMFQFMSRGEIIKLFQGDKNLSKGERRKLLNVIDSYRKSVSAS